MLFFKLFFIFTTDGKASKIVYRIVLPMFIFSLRPRILKIYRNNYDLNKKNKIRILKTLYATQEIVLYFIHQYFYS